MRKSRSALHIVALFILGLWGGQVVGLPPGYKEDFNGCSQNSPSESDRKRCCDKTHDDCKRQCKADHENDIDLQIRCVGSCALASHDCNQGIKLNKLVVDGAHGVAVPGVSAGDGEIVPGDLVRFAPAPDVLPVQIHYEKLDDVPTCLGVVVSCACPSERAERGYSCRPVLTGGNLGCQVCRVWKEQASCVPCKECRPVVQAVHTCDTPAEGAAVTGERGP
jgi:hypothetical protein